MDLKRYVDRKKFSVLVMISERADLEFAVEYNFGLISVKLAVG